MEEEPRFLLEIPHDGDVSYEDELAITEGVDQSDSDTDSSDVIDQSITSTG